MAQTVEHDRYLTRPQAAEVLSMSAGYLARLTHERRGPRMTKFGTAFRSPVRYRLADVLAWAREPAAHEREVWGSTKRQRNARRQKAGR